MRVENINHLQQLLEEVKNLSINDLEKLIGIRYEVGASQKELDLLEIEYSQRDIEVSHEDIGEDDQIDYRSSLDEILSETYKNHFINKFSTFGTDKYFVVNIKSNLLSSELNTGFKENDVKKLTYKEIILIAKDCYKRNMKFKNGRKYVEVKT